MNKKTFLILTLGLAWLCQAMLWNAAEARPNADVQPEPNVRHEAAAMVLAGQGDVIVVWRAVVPEGSDIYAQKLGTDGRQIWRNGGVEICHQSTADAHFSAVTDSEGGVIIVWEDSREGRYNTDIYAQRLDEHGNMVWGSDGVPLCTAEHQQQFPEAVSDQHGGGFVFWTDYRNGNADIFGCHLNPRGTVVHRFAICTEKDDQTDLAVAASNSGSACLVWVDHRYDFPGIYAQLIDRNDSLRWRADGLPICTGVYQQESPAVASVNDSTFLVVWADYRARLAKVFTQFVDFDGHMLLPSGGSAVAASAGPQYIPTICAADSTLPVVTWLQYGRGARMFQQRIGIIGPRERTTSFGISESSLAQFWSNSVADGRGGSFTIWLEYKGGKIEIFGQHTGYDNRLEWVRGGLLLGSAIKKSHPQIVFDKIQHTLFVAWTSNSTKGSKITVSGMTEGGAIKWKREL
jgi:hypothetical protein